MPADRVVLVRHGRTASNATKRWQGRTDIPLDDVGVRQAARTAAVLPLVAPGAVRLVASDLSRARATAEPLAAAYGLELELDPRLQEVWAGEWENLERDEVRNRWPDELAKWENGEDIAPGGGEKLSAAGHRVMAAIEELAAATPTGTLVVVSHGGCMRSALQQLLGFSYGELPLGVLTNAAWGEIFRGRQGEWRLSSWNVQPDPEAPDTGTAEPAASAPA